jgi:hypothetical protein
MPADLSQRPDIAAMQESIPRPDPRSATRLQAEAHRAAGAPYVNFGGTRWYISGQPDVFDMAELGESFAVLDDGNWMPAFGMSNRILRRYLADYQGFRAKFREVHATGMTEAAVQALADVAQEFMEAVTARPTGPPADSSAGPSSTSTTSRDGSPSPEPGTLPGSGGWDTYIRE